MKKTVVRAESTKKNRFGTGLLAGGNGLIMLIVAAWEGGWLLVQRIDELCTRREIYVL